MKHIFLAGMLACTVFVGVTLSAETAGAQAQPPVQAQRGGARGQPPAAVTPVEAERLFDAYVLVQAQDSLGLSEAQFPEFIAKLKALQDVRRRHLLGRRKIILDLQRSTGPKAAAPFDEARVRELLRSLAELDARTADDLRKAQEALDQTLDVRQQARFRVFEDQVERRKLDLLLRARRAAAAAGREGQPPGNPIKDKK
jgi:hypothetical protein